MKKYICLLLSLFLFIPFVVKAETLTYNVCESGCEYTNLGEVETLIRNIGNLDDKDIVVNINSDLSDGIVIGSNNNITKSLTINGNNYDISFLTTYANNVTINNLKISDNDNASIAIYYSQKIKINNSDVKQLIVLYIDSNLQIKIEKIDLNDVLEIDENTLNNLRALQLFGNIKMNNMDLSNIVLSLNAGTYNIYNSKIEKITHTPFYGAITTNIYNSKFNTLKYINITSSQKEAYNELQQFSNSFDLSTLNYDIYDFMSPEYSNTTVYFDKEAKLKPGNKLNLVNYLDYYTEDKEIEYTLEDESIAKIDNKELTALKEGSTKVTVTTDDGHVVYRINLTVEKETIPEKIDKMTIKVPITGSKVKAWILIVGGILLGIALICVYMLIKRKK